MSLGSLNPKPFVNLIRDLLDISHKEPGCKGGRGGFRQAERGGGGEDAPPWLLVKLTHMDPRIPTNPRDPKIPTNSIDPVRNPKL